MLVFIGVLEPLLFVLAELPVAAEFAFYVAQDAVQPLSVNDGQKRKGRCQQGKDDG